MPSSITATIGNLTLKAPAVAMSASFLGAFWFGMTGKVALLVLCLKVFAGCLVFNILVHAFLGSTWSRPAADLDDEKADPGDIVNDPHANPCGRFDLGVVKPQDDDLLSK